MIEETKWPGENRIQSSKETLLCLLLEVPPYPAWELGPLIQQTLVIKLPNLILKVYIIAPPVTNSLGLGFLKSETWDKTMCADSLFWE